MTLLALLLIVGSVSAWLIWANSEYQGYTRCPFDAPVKGHPFLVGLALSLISAALMGMLTWRQRSLRRALALGLVTMAAVGVALVITALFFGAGLGCQD
jgi:hypothetical protein